MLFRSGVSSSEDLSIEYPVDEAHTSILRRGQDLDFEIVERPTGAGGAREFWLKFYNPPSGVPGAWRLRYSGRYQQLSESSSLADLTALAVDRVGLLAAIYTARTLAAKFGKTIDPTIPQDTVDYRSKSGE